jgi:hypothetical protein
MAEQGNGFLKEIYGTIKLITYRTVIQSSESAIQMLPPARGGY